MSAPCPQTTHRKTHDTRTHAQGSVNLLGGGVKMLGKATSGMTGSLMDLAGGKGDEAEENKVRATFAPFIFSLFIFSPWWEQASTSAASDPVVALFHYG